MSIEVTCSQCNTSHHVHERLAGRRVRCPQCETVVHVPEAEIVPGEFQEPADSLASKNGPAENRLSAENLAPPPAFAAPGGIQVAPAVTPPSLDFSSLTATVPEEDEDEVDEVLVRSKRPEEEMDMTPMVDVTFLLLIFFMVTAAFSLQKSIEMPRQQTDAPSTSVIEEESEDLDMVEVQVDEFGSFLVMAPDWERETPGKQNLISTLKEAMGTNNDGMRLVIKVHEMAKLRALVDAMDAGTIAGYSQLEVTQVEEFD